MLLDIKLIENWSICIENILNIVDANIFRVPSEYLLIDTLGIFSRIIKHYCHYLKYREF